MEISNPSQHHADAFQLLGYTSGPTFYYLPKGAKMVIALRSDQHVEGKLISIASKQWWEQNYGGDWRLAANAMIQLSYRVGIFNPDRVRGRGAWWDNGISTLHIGNRLIVSGEEKELGSSTHYIYEAAEPIRINYKNPLTVGEAERFSKICDMLTWEQKISSRYLAGWCAIAPICGALNWRPHIWVTGAKGSGKSWTAENIVTPIVGDIGLFVLASTTEAGIRQELGHDARPLIFDEIDGSGEKAKARIDSVLDLARPAASEGKAKLLKGTVTGKAMSFKVRFCAAFFSIGVAATRSQDESRVTVLSMAVGFNPEKFKLLEGMTAELITEEYIQRFTARSVRLIPEIRESYRIFKAAAAKLLGNQRAGDQIGALLAGAWSLHSDKAVTVTEAVAWLNKEDWAENKANGEHTDEIKCLSHLLQSIIKSPAEGSMRDFSVADLVDMASGRKYSPDNDRNSAINTLGMNGLRGDPDGLVVSSSHSAIARLLKGTDWDKNWKLTLGRLAGAYPTRRAVRFGSVRTHGVTIPYDKEEDDLDR